MKKILLLCVTLLLCFNLSVPAIAASSFTDVPATFWAYTEIMEAVNKGITNGYADGTFKPGNSVTNAHFAAFLARAFYSDEYNDKNASPWYKPYTNVLASHGVFEGTALGTNFDGNINKAINRYDMAEMMYHILKNKDAKMPTNAEMAAARTAIGDWSTMPSEYRGAVSLCYAMGVLNGQSDGTFGGNNLMNRAQGCVVVYRLTKKIEAGSTGIETPEEPTEPETPVTPSTGSGTLANGKAVTEENVAELLESLKSEYPDKGYYDPYNPSYYFKAMGVSGTECAKLAYMVSDEIFGTDASIRSHYDYSNIKIGDIIEVKNENGQTTHWAVVNKFGVAPSGRTYIEAVSGGSDGVISWTYRFYVADMDNEVIWTRYPE